MAIVTSNFSNWLDAEKAVSIDAGLTTEHALSWAVAAFDNLYYFPMHRVDTFSNIQISGELATGDYVNLFGSF